VSSRGLPAGTVTFVFTDIEGSTRLLDRLGGAMYAQLLDQHNRVLIDAFTCHGGVVFGAEGDAMFVAFERATAAMAAVIDAQLELGDTTWPDGAVARVRMGVHTGEVDVVGDNYVGMSVHVAARLSAAGHGGQVLLSEATHRLAPDVAAVDLGSHQLKDVGDVGIWQLTHPSLQRDFPPLRTLTATNNLPAPVDSFIGRRAELAEVLHALGDCRLVTLTGPGGSGKTRLALEAATAVLSSYRNGVWFVSLAGAREGNRVVPLVAAALGVPESSDDALADTLEYWLRDRQLLLVLDNCEPVVGAVASVAERYLQRCGGVRILATSRELLGVRGERATGGQIGIAHAVEARGIIAYDRNELADAAAFVAEAIEIYRSNSNLGCCAHALESAAVILGQAAQPETATELLGAAEELRRISGAANKPFEIRARHPDIEDRIAPLSPAVHEAALTAGHQHTLESAARTALDALSTAARK
jgi:class 3 adenylate cyclase